MDGRNAVPDEITSNDPVLARRLGRPALTALVAAALLVGGTLGIYHLQRPAQPPLLALQVSATDTPALAALGVPAKVGENTAPVIGFGGYRLAGPLPDGPARAHVWQLKGGATDAAAVRALATSLGLDAAPERVDGGWVVTHADRRLVVRDADGWSWTYGDVNPGCPPIPAQSLPPDALVSSSTVGCAWTTSVGSGGSATTSVDAGSATTSAPDPTPVGASSGVPMPPVVLPPGPPVTDPPSAGWLPVDLPPADPLPLGPTEEAALAAAQPVLDRLALGSAAVRAVRGFGTTEVVAEAVVGDLPTVGLATYLRFDSTLTLVEGSGWLATPRQAPSYPLVSATAAFDQLAGGPRPDIAFYCPPNAMCPAPVAQVVTGARLGLLLDYAQEGGQLVPILVPAWLFALAGQDVSLPVVAIDPTFLRAASPAPGKPAPVPPGEPASPPAGQSASMAPAPLPPVPNSEPAGSLPGSGGTPPR